MKYDIRVYYDNDATRHDITDEVNFAEGVRLSAPIPSVIKANSETLAAVTLSPDNAEPQKVWDGIV